MKIRTAYDPPADCGRSLYDWIAIDDESWDGERGPIGFGPTETEAVLDLLKHIQRRRLSEHIVVEDDPE
jgi:hypothetical protein